MTRKIETKKFSLPFGLLSPLYCALCICIDQTSPIGRNTCSTIRNNTLLAPARQLLKDNIPP